MSINQPIQHLYGAFERLVLLRERLPRWPALLGTLAVCLCLGGVTAPVSAAPDVPPLAAEASVARVNINTADAATLAARLKGVGLSRAQDIIRYREAYGPFKSVEELADVKGIGQSTLERNRTVITLD
jgi:competence protein ComEA|tara:strand:- start:20292 stop:20675 length:384 start_codon:yes stop_codon:yes gene_type:complete